MSEGNSTPIVTAQDGEEIVSQVCTTTVCMSLPSRQELDHELKVIRDYLLKMNFLWLKEKQERLYYRNQNVKWLMGCYII